MNRNVNKIGIVFVLATVILLIVSALTVKLFKSHTANKSNSLPKYTMRIKVDTHDEQDKKETFLITTINDGINSKTDLSYINNPIYGYNGNLIYKSSGRYKEIDKKNSYIDIYRLLAEIDLGKEVKKDANSVDYNPTLTRNEINKIIDALCLGKETKRDEKAYIVIENGTLKEFSIYLIDIDGYRGINIVISFTELDKERKVEMPKIYDELIDRVEEKELYIIK